MAEHKTLEMLDWDDTELVDTWDLALKEYNKYYSLSSQENRKQREASVKARANSKTTQVREATNYAELEPQAVSKPKQKKGQKKKKKLNKQSIPIDKIQQILMPNCTCNVKGSKYMEECIDSYYKGYKDGAEAVAIAGSGGSINDFIPSRGDPWYLCGFDTAKIV